MQKFGDPRLAVSHRQIVSQIIRLQLLAGGTHIKLGNCDRQSVGRTVRLNQLCQHIHVGKIRFAIMALFAEDFDQIL